MDAEDGSLNERVEGVYIVVEMVLRGTSPFRRPIQLYGLAFSWPC